jgi:enamine deaminase RidA (YjgF/YER057c/UK114 family)
MKFIILLISIMPISKTIYSQVFSNPETLFDPRPYGFSHVVSIPAGHALVFVAGQGGEEVSGDLSQDFRRQVYRALRNIEAALQSQGLRMDAVAKVTTLVVDHDADKLKILIEEFHNVWPDQKFPVNTLIPVPRLALDNMLVEIDATAILNRK